MKSNLLGSIAIAMLVAACSGGEPRPPVDPVKPVATSALNAPATSSAAPSASPAPSASAAAAAPAEPEKPSPFFIAYEQPFLGLNLHRAGSVAIAVSGQANPYIIDARGVHAEPGLFKGLPGPNDGDSFNELYHIVSISGDWPRTADITVSQGYRGVASRDFRWTGSRWVERPGSGVIGQETWEIAIEMRWNIEHSVPWLGGRSLFVVTADDTKKFKLKGSSAGLVLPEAAPAPAGVPCPSRIETYLDVRGFSTGEIFATGRECKKEGEVSEKDPLLVERWVKGSKKSTVDTLPNSEGVERIDMNGWFELPFMVFSPTQVFVRARRPAARAGGPVKTYLARFDGAGWTDISPPADGDVRELYPSRDGVLWARFDDDLYRYDPKPGESSGWRLASPNVKKFQWMEVEENGLVWVSYSGDLWRFTPGTSWEKLPMPMSHEEGSPPKRYIPESVMRISDKDVIVVASAGTKQAIFLNSKPEAVVRPPPGAEKGAVQAAPPPVITPATPSCKETFVILYKLSKVAPADFDFPLTRAAIKGHMELAPLEFAETEEVGRRYLIASAPSYSMAKDLVRLISEKVPSSKPQMLCGKPPRVNRRLKVNLKTGELVK